MLMHCNLTIKGVYKASGRILIVSINGDGDAKIKISKYFKLIENSLQNRMSKRSGGLLPK